MNRQPVATQSLYYQPHHYTSHLLHSPSPQQQHQHQQQQQQHYHDPALGSLGYRLLQLPVQPQHHHSHTDQQRLSLAAFQTPNFRHPHHPEPAIPFRARQQARRGARQHQQTMAYEQTPEELAELQKLSNEYEPEASGPLVGPRAPSTAITTEYASADPIFQAKTAALPQKFSYYRTVRGDGRCGWRAIAFGYFETLIRLGDGNKFLEEETRLRSLSNVLNAAGYEPFLYEDFTDEAFDLFRSVAGALHTGDADTILYDSFNDETIQNYFITYLRILTSAWMKTRPGDYAPWLLGQTVDSYCDSQVMPTSSEIDNVSLSALKDVFLSPAGIALEVHYLDRTEGSEVNMHRFDPVNPGGYTIGTVRLLYRPGHYDLIYKVEDLPAEPAIVPTYLQYSSHTHREPVYDIGVSDFMIQIPGMSYATPSHGWVSTPSFESDFFTPSAHARQCTQPLPTPAAIAQPQIVQQSQYVPTTPPHMVAPPSQIPQEMVIRTAPHASMAHSGLQHHIGGPFRPSAWELEPDFVQATSQMPFTTSIFRNSHFNTAHFLNPDFQPEEWRPDDEYVTTTNTSKVLRHKTSG